MQTDRPMWASDTTRNRAMGQGRISVAIKDEKKRSELDGLQSKRIQICHAGLIGVSAMRLALYKVIPCKMRIKINNPLYKNHVRKTAHDTTTTDKKVCNTTITTITTISPSLVRVSATVDKE